jgi:hypothetical protein
VELNAYGALETPIGSAGRCPVRRCDRGRAGQPGRPYMCWRMKLSITRSRKIIFGPVVMSR